jgi:PAS domain-containing protein
MFESAADFLAGEGEMSGRLRAYDWSRMPLGTPETWPRSLRSIVDLMLAAKQAMFLAWEPDLTFLYNDAYAPALGAKHPGALGRPLAEVWSDTWAQIQLFVERNLAGEGIYFEDLRVPMERSGYPEEAWFTFSCTPVRDEAGEVAYIFCAGVKTTEKVRAEAALRARLSPRSIASFAPTGPCAGSGARSSRSETSYGTVRWVGGIAQDIARHERPLV